MSFEVLFILSYKLEEYLFNHSVFLKKLCSSLDSLGPREKVLLSKVKIMFKDMR